MRCFALFILLCTWSIAAPSTFAQSSEAQQDGQLGGRTVDLAAIAEQALADVAVWANKESFSVPIENVERATIKKIVRSNIQGRLQPDEEFPLHESTLNTLTASLVGIYDMQAQRVAICMENIHQLAETLDIPLLARDESVYAIVVHELGHALADQRYGLRAFLTKAGKQGPDALMAAEAVMEGYSQHVARQVCTRTKKLAGFNTFTSAITALPPDLDAGERLLSQMLVSMVTFSYIDGEGFVRAVLATKQEDIEERLFRNPPTSRTEIGRPEWYLDPKTRPSHGFDLESGVASLTHAFQNEPGFQFTQRELAGAELASANAILGIEKSTELGNLVMTCLANVGMPPDGEKMTILALSVFETEAAADRFLALAHEASKAKDEALREGGSISIIASGSHAVSPSDGKGSIFRKTVKYAGQNIPVTNALVQRGRLILDLTLSNHEMKEPAMLRLIRDSFARAGATQAN